MINISAIKRAIIGAVICVTLGSCAGFVEMMEIAGSIEAQDDKHGRIMFFIDNQASEVLVLFVNGYFKGAELARVPVGSMRRIYISKGRKIYVSGGTTQKQYGQWECNNDSEIFSIY
ncbi:MAG: hypothetical protein LBK00_08290 [Treponema sp.]|nr:hypothetical protein [Treponema sp.]